MQISGIVSRPVVSQLRIPTLSSPVSVGDRVSIGGALASGIPGTMFGFLPAVGALTNHLGGQGVPAWGQKAALVGTVANLAGLVGYMAGMPNVAGLGLLTSAVCSGAVWGYRGGHGIK